MDATALAMAQAREQAKDDKAPETTTSRGGSVPRITVRGGRNGGHPMATGPAPSTSTKRPKKPG